MKVTQEKLPASQISLEIEISPEMSKNAYEQIIKKYIRSANIPGFRKGKVPRNILIQRLGKNYIKAMALDDLINNCLEKAREQESIKAIGQFELKTEFEELVKDFEPGKEMAFSAKVDVEPEAKVEDYKGFLVQAEEAKYDSALVDEFLEERRSRMGTLIPIEGRAAEMGDVAIVDFVGIIPSETEGEEAQEVPGGKAQDFQMDLKEGQFIPGFIEGIVGMKLQETKEISAQFPSEYSEANLAGKPVVFTVTLKELKEKELPELDDDLAQEISEFETIDKLREFLEQKFTKEKEEKTKQNKEKAIIDELVTHLEVEIPETLIKNEVQQMLAQSAMDLSQYGIDVKEFFSSEKLPEMQERTRPEAIERLKRDLVIATVAKRESITVDEEEIKAESQKVVKQLKEKDFDSDRLRQVVTQELLKEKTIKWLEANGTVELVPEGTLHTESQTPQTTEILETEVESEIPQASETIVEVKAEEVATVENSQE
ncbi:trigger factor [Trichodesmium erythraeum IMS101]|uniref:Trigger factor n=1 Tax=Trichodesmium erythraeum (strain IMS101) TaxID=203124 RepID=TIG_TRIEI|nr:RecName: Full=Trigger factor; Short=TF; AltName: Full=PPIase [Trichodesmium erythraeum IMS101]MBS9770311.1 trigger factor [Trichodesmium erythraeum GBRTRLIN201]